MPSPDRPHSSRHWVRQYPAFLAIVLILASTWVAYAPGFSGSLHFDDEPNLSQLSKPLSNLGVLHFIFDGNAGPLGRPVSLATFAVQRGQWPENTRALLQTNVALHLLTALFVYLLALGLAHILRARRPQWVAALAMGLWVLSPLLASTPLLLIQRMTILGGLFVFAGLSGYVWSRILHQKDRLAGAFLMVAAITLGTLAAAFSKENGILLPILVLIIEYTLIRKRLVNTDRAFRTIFILLAVIPTVFILTYLALKIPNLFYADGHREFTPLQRLLSQPQILLEYVRLLLIPNAQLVTPFADDRTAAQTIFDLGVAASSLAWVALISVGFYFRKAFPVFLFSISFFLVGHLLESSLIYLELYFAHRNYVPAFGLYFLIAFLFLQVAEQRSFLGWAAGAGYLAVFFISLFSVTSLWGQPLVASAVWAKEHPHSMRAREFLANAHLSLGDHQTALKVLSQANDIDRSGIIALQRIYLCNFPTEDGQTADQYLSAAKRKIAKGPRRNSIGTLIIKITQRTLSGQCKHMDAVRVQSLIEAAFANHHVVRSASISSQLHNAKYLIALAQGSTKDQVESVRAMYETTQHVNHAIPLGTLLAKTEGRTAALAFLEQARSETGMHFLRNAIRGKIIDEHIDWLEENDLFYSGSPSP